MKYYTLYFGQAYGEGNYGNCNYQPTTQQAQDCAATTGGGTGTGTSSGAGGSALTNTGIAVIGIVTIACLIIFVSLIARIWRRKPAAQPVAVEEPAENTDDNQRV